MSHTLPNGDFERIRADLQRNASLFDQPDAYVAGVEDTIAALLAAGPDSGSHRRAEAMKATRDLVAAEESGVVAH